MQSREYMLADGRRLLVVEAAPEDAREVVDYVERVSGESDFLSFGPGEFDFSEEQEKEFLRRCRAADNHLYLLGRIDQTIVASLSFCAGHRPRTRHCGEFGMSVRKAFWGLGIGSALLEAFLDWARDNGFVTKINLRVRTDNQRAIDLYSRKGFENEGTIRKETFLNGKYYDHHCMGLELI